MKKVDKNKKRKIMNCPKIYEKDYGIIKWFN